MVKCDFKNFPRTRASHFERNEREDRILGHDTQPQALRCTWANALSCRFDSEEGYGWEKIGRSSPVSCQTKGLLTSVKSHNNCFPPTVPGYISSDLYVMVVTLNAKALVIGAKEGLRGRL
jgi:hypothetical protein